MTTTQSPRQTKSCGRCYGKGILDGFFTDSGEDEPCPQCKGSGQVPTAVAARSNATTEKQVAFATKLMDEYKALVGDIATPEVVAALDEALTTGMETKAQASKFIDAMIDTIKRTRQAQAEKARVELANRQAERKAGHRDAADVDGMYLLPDGRIVKVQYAVHGSGKPYAKLLTKLDVPKTSRGKEIGWDFEYAPGLVKECKPEFKMTLEQAKEWGALYGACCNCGATLTDEVSIEAGIGPVCAKRFA
jgi:hypothetical protein